VKNGDFAEFLRAERADILLNVHALFVLPPDVVLAPRVGSFNLHPGPLPQYAGLNVPSWAIYHGERMHGVTVHWMEAGIDTGPIAYDASFEIDAEDTGLSLSAKCVRAGIPLIDQLLDMASGDPEAVPRRPQSGTRRYYGRTVPHDGWLVWTASAERIVNFVRACDYLPFGSPWGQPRALLAGSEIKVLKASRTLTACDAAPGTVGQVLGQDALVATGDEWVLVRRVRVGATECAAAEVLKAGERLGWDLQSEGL
jgi:UDP-4-amino-4-deoxy-L-arabinose formyltransferase/UDP-glucuronic acid dehydrogenase (UDP-4-keto-hexauronic acid decarboxylating)